MFQCRLAVLRYPTGSKEPWWWLVGKSSSATSIRLPPPPALHQQPSLPFPSPASPPAPHQQLVPRLQQPLQLLLRVDRVDLW